MHDHSQPMNVHRNDNAASAANSLDQHHIAYDGGSVAANSLDQHHITYDEEGDIIVDGDSSVYISEAELLMPQGNVSSQLTLTFRGQVYVFDSVTPEKVQAVLLLLGGCELTPGFNDLEAAAQNQKGVMEYPGRSSTPQRVASLNRFRQKRKERCFDKKVRYSVRQEVALRMKRNKGQFTSSKKPDDWVQDVSQETLCTHCGTSSKSTPMMRRGPSGPRSLCNACGLFWANRGTLRDHAKKTQDNPSTPIEQGEAEANESDFDLVGYSNGDDSVLRAENGASGLSPN